MLNYQTAQQLRAGELLKLEETARRLGAVRVSALHDGRRGRVDVTLHLPCDDPARMRADLGTVISRLSEAQAWPVAGISYYAAETSRVA